MTFEEVRDATIKIGIASVHEHETDPVRIRGCLTGFQVAAGLDTPQQFTDLIEQRARAERELRDRRVSSDEYWEYRCATAQVEHVWEVLKVGLEIYPQYGSKVLLYARILEEHGETISG